MRRLTSLVCVHLPGMLWSENVVGGKLRENQRAAINEWLLQSCFPRMREAQRPILPTSLTGFPASYMCASRADQQEERHRGRLAVTQPAAAMVGVFQHQGRRRARGAQRLNSVTSARRKSEFVVTRNWRHLSPTLTRMWTCDWPARRPAVKVLTDPCATAIRAPRRYRSFPSCPRMISPSERAREVL